MKNFLVEVCPTRYLGHTCIEVICWLSEIKIEGGILNFISNPICTPSPESMLPINRGNEFLSQALFPGTS